MMVSNQDGPSLAPDDAAQVIARATMLDARHADGMSLPRLREIAHEVGIHPDAVLEALDEHASQRETVVPMWVRLCTMGVPDRAAAVGFYWLFIAGIVAAPLHLVLVHSRFLGATLFLAMVALCFSASWSTSAAIRWLDRHGWDRLR